MKTYHLTVETIGGAQYTLAEFTEEQYLEALGELYPASRKYHSLESEPLPYPLAGNLGSAFIAPRSVSSVKVITAED